VSAGDTRGSRLPNVFPVGLFRTDTAGRCLAVNAHWCEITGLASAEALDEGWARALHPDDRERVLTEWSRATQEARGLEMEFRFQHWNGTVTQVLVQSLPELDARGTISGFVGAVTDLSRHLEVQDELHANRELVAMVLLATTDGHWDWNVATGTVSRRAPRHPLPGGPLDEVAPDAHALAQRIHPEDCSRVRDCMMAHLAGHTALYECEHRRLTGTGTWEWVLQRGRVVARDAAGNPLCMLRVYIDIETRKQAEAEAEIEAYHAQLQRFALQLALAQDRERRRIAAGLHEDLGQILAVARAKLGQLTESGTGGDVPSGASEIRALLDSAIAETRALTFELGSPILHELGLAAAVESLCERLGNESGVQFRVVAEREPESLGGDLRTLLYRAVRELCRNVVRHARAPRAEVRLYTEGDRLQIVVADDGEGFDAARQARHFDRTGGFGLFAIREMCAQVGGRFEIESAAGKGARAVLSVPLG